MKKTMDFSLFSILSHPELIQSTTSWNSVGFPPAGNYSDFMKHCPIYSLRTKKYRPEKKSYFSFFHSVFLNWNGLYNFTTTPFWRKWCILIETRNLMNWLMNRYWGLKRILKINQQNHKNAIVIMFKERILNPVKHLRWSVL